MRVFWPPIWRTALAAVIILAVTWIFADDARAQNAGEEVPEVTGTYALVDARVVQAPGQVLEEATVVVRDGLIADVGRSVDIPYDAERIDADSLTVYAGFIDGLSHAGMPEPETSRNERQESVDHPGNPESGLAGIRPDRRAREIIDPEDDRIAELRRLGFTASHVVPEGDMLPGTGAVVLFAGDNPSDMILRPEKGLFAQFDPAPNMYPETQMGVLAKLRQLYREAERRREMQEGYDETPKGRERPTYGPIYEAFYPVIEGSRSIYFHTDDALDIHRALNLRNDLNVPMVVTGLRQSFETIDLLEDAQSPLFLTLGLPDAPESSPDSSAAADTAASSDRPEGIAAYDPDLRTESYRDVDRQHQNLELRQKIERQRYLTTAARLHDTGLSFGFSSLNVASDDIWEHLRTMVTHGLPEEAAVAALTTYPAETLGLSEQLGTIEAGKIANLVVTTDSLFAPGRHIRYVFVDGEKFEYERSSPRASATDSSADGTERTAVQPIDPAASHLKSNAPRYTQREGDVLVQNGTVLTITNGTLENTDVLVRDGTIAEIGRDLDAPEDVETVDASGRYVMPGIVDAHAHIAIDDINEATNPVTSEVRVGDILDPYDLDLYRALAGGVTVTHTMHGSANVIGGQNETIKHRFGLTDPEALKMNGAPRTIKFALGENPIRLHGESHDLMPISRMGVEFIIRQALNEAERYRNRWEQYREARDDGQNVTAPEYSERLEIISKILSGEIQVHCHSYRADEILMLMNVLEDFGVENATFQHVNEGFKIAPELAEFGAGASVFSDWWAYKFEVYYSTAYNAAILTRNGVLTSINSDSPELNRHLYHEAAKTQKYGDLSDTEALSLITINPARQLGIADRVGSIEEGKDGDLAIFSEHPLSIYSICQRTIVDGVTRFDREDDPDDMRLQVDPETPVQPAAERSRENNHLRLRDVDLYQFMRKAVEEGTR